MDNVTLRTPRLELVPSSPELFDGVWAAVEASLDELSSWMPWAVEPDPEGTRTFLEHAAKSWGSGRDRSFTIAMDGVVCGGCSLDHIDPWGHSAEMGYWMRSDLCGRGLMTEAASEVVSFGFDNEGLHRIGLHAGVENHASCRVAEKLGFQKEGLLRHKSKGKRGFYDCYTYGLLTTDPRPDLAMAR